MWRASGAGYNLLFNMLPSNHAALYDFSGLLSLAGKRVERAVRDLDGFGFLKPLSDGEKKRWRFSRSYSGSREFSQFGPRWCRGISLAFDIMPPLVRKEVVSIFDELGISKIRCEEDLNDIFVEMTSIYKKHGFALSQQWKWFVNWELLGGFRADLSFEDELKSIQDWVGVVRDHTFPGSDGVWTRSSFLNVYRDGCDKFLAMAPSLGPANDRIVSIHDWAGSPSSWAGSGSSSHKVRFEFLDLFQGKVLNAGKNKWRFGLATDPDKIIALFSVNTVTDLTPVSKSIQKAQPDKVRAVITSDDDTYIRCAYVYSYLDAALKHHPICTLYSSKQQMVDVLVGMSTRLGNLIQLPADQSKFDLHVLSDMIAVMIDSQSHFISKTVLNRSLRDELLATNGRVSYALTKLRYFVGVRSPEGVTRNVEVVNGLLSGLRGTAAMGSLSNYATLHCAQMLLKQMGFEDQLVAVLLQGDDDDFQLRSYGYAAALMHAYKVLGFSINPKKFFIDTERDEFLRQVGTRDGTSGYPVRGIGSVLWRGPTTRDPPAGNLRVREIADSWSLLIGRGASRERVMKFMIRDICGASNLNKVQAQRILGTPAVLGGLGCLVENLDYLGFSVGRQERSLKLVTWPVPGLRVELEKLVILGFDLRREFIERCVFSRIDVSSARSFSVPGEVFDVGRIVPFRWPISSGGHVPLGARHSDLIPRTVASVVLEQCIRDKDWAWIREHWLHPDLRLTSLSIESKGGRGVWVDWLGGNLPFKLPRILGCNNILLSFWHQQFCLSVFSHICTFSSFNRLTVLRAALTAEQWVHEQYSISQVSVGG